MAALESFNDAIEELLTDKAIGIGIKSIGETDTEDTYRDRDIPKNEDRNRYNNTRDNNSSTRLMSAGGGDQMNVGDDSKIVSMRPELEINRITLTFTNPDTQRKFERYVTLNSINVPCLFVSFIPVIGLTLYCICIYLFQSSIPSTEISDTTMKGVAAGCLIICIIQIIAMVAFLYCVLKEKKYRADLEVDMLDLEFQLNQQRRRGSGDLNLQTDNRVNSSSLGRWVGGGLHRGSGGEGSGGGWVEKILSDDPMSLFERSSNNRVNNSNSYNHNHNHSHSHNSNSNHNSNRLGLVHHSRLPAQASMSAFEVDGKSIYIHYNISILYYIIFYCIILYCMYIICMMQYIFIGMLIY